MRAYKSNLTMKILFSLEVTSVDMNYYEKCLVNFIDIFDGMFYLDLLNKANYV